MKLLMICIFALSLTGCANMHRQEWKPGQRFGLTFVSEHHGCKDKLLINGKITYTKCF